MADKKPNSNAFDAGRQHLGKVYAKGLIAAAESKGQAAAVCSELESLVADVLEKLPQFDAALSSPRISPEEKAALLEKAFGGKMSTVLLTFLKVVARHGRLDSLRWMARAARTCMNDIEGRVAVKVVTADATDGATSKAVEAGLQAKLGGKLDLTTEVNSDLIGGMIVRVGDTVFDGSVRLRLARLKALALERTAETIHNSLGKFAAE